MISSVVAAIAERRATAAGIVVAGGSAMILGAIAGLQPKVAIGFAGAALLAFVAVRAPTASLVSLIFLTAVVPYGIANRFGVGSGLNSLAFCSLMFCWCSASQERV
jgi:hypothetical protein